MASTQHKLTHWVTVPQAFPYLLKGLLKGASVEMVVIVSVLEFRESWLIMWIYIVSPDLSE